MSAPKDDYGVLNKPAKMSQKGIYQIILFLNQGSREVRDLLINECDTIFECKVCKSLFRSLANFIVHKRGFCKEHCCEKMLLFENCDVPEDTNTDVVEPEGAPNICDSDQEDRDDDVHQTQLITSKAKIYCPLSAKVLEVEKQPKKSGKISFMKCLDEITNKALKRNFPTHSVELKKMSETKNAVMQALYGGHVEKKPVVPTPEESGSDADVEMDTDSVVSRKVGNAERGLTMAERLKLRDDCTVKTLMCNICEQTFCSVKSLNRHMQNQHVEHKLHYPCSCCTAIFLNLDKLGDHLVDSHDKSADQVSKLQSLSRSKRFLKEIDAEDTNEVAVKEEKVTCLCPRCGRSFDQVRFLTSHLKYCKSTGNERRSCVTNSYGTDASLTDRPRRVGVEKKVAADFVNSQTLNWRNGSTTSSSGSKSAKVCPVKRLNWSSPVKNSEGKSSMSLSKRLSPDMMEKKVSSYINIDKLQCRICKKRFSSTSNLRRHVAIHLGWNRFRCKMCSFQAYNKFDVRVHISKQHANVISDEDIDSMVVDLKAISESTSGKDKKSKLSKGKSSPVSVKMKNSAESMVPTMKIKLDKSGKVGEVTLNANDDNRKGQSTTNTSKKYRSDNISTLKTRSGTYLKEDKLCKMREGNLKTEPMEENSSEMEDESDEDEDDVHSKSSRQLKSSRSQAKRRKLDDHETERKLVHSNVQGVRSLNNMNTSSDEGEQRISKRKQSFSNVLIDEDEEMYTSPNRLGHKKSSMSRSSSLTNLRDSPKGSLSPLSRTNPNSPMKGAFACGTKLVISDDLGRVVREVPVDTNSPKKNKRKEMTPMKKPIVGTMLNFDKPVAKGPRLQNIGLLRKLKTVVPRVEKTENPSDEPEPSASGGSP